MVERAQIRPNQHPRHDAIFFGFGERHALQLRKRHLHRIDFLKQRHGRRSSGFFQSSYAGLTRVSTKRSRHSGMVRRTRPQMCNSTSGKDSGLALCAPRNDGFIFVGSVLEAITCQVILPMTFDAARDKQLLLGISSAMRQFPPRRIVCLTEETVETLYLLGEQDRIVGISGYVVRPPQARREKPRVSAFTYRPVLIPTIPRSVLSAAVCLAPVPERRWGLLRVGGPVPHLARQSAVLRVQSEG